MYVYMYNHMQQVAPCKGHPQKITRVVRRIVEEVIDEDFRLFLQ